MFVCLLVVVFVVGAHAGVAVIGVCLLNVSVGLLVCLFTFVCLLVCFVIGVGGGVGVGTGVAMVANAAVVAAAIVAVAPAVSCCTPWGTIANEKRPQE